MLPLRSASWTVRHLARRPEAWLALTASCVAWPLVVVLSPLTLTMTPADASRLAADAGWLGALIGAALALQTLGRHAWILERGSRSRATWARLSGLAAGGGMGAAFSLALPLIWGRSFELPWGMLGLAVGISVLHLTLLSACLLQLPLLAGREAASLIVAAWVIPGLIPGSGPVLGRLASLLDSRVPTAALRDSTLSATGEALLPILALSLLLLLTSATPLSKSRGIAQRRMP